MSACKPCSENQKPPRLTPIGRSVVITTSFGSGHDHTEHFFSQCDECGSVWVKYVDSGAGGHGRFWKRLTAGLF